MSVVEDIAEIFQDYKKNADRIAALVSYFGEEGSRVDNVAVNNAHAAIESVEVYGLTIGVDANGYASEVHFPHGALIE